MTVAAVENLLKASRSAIIDLLKLNGAMSVEDLARSLGVSRVCVRRHLALLESDGLIGYSEERHERGRPRFIFRLTEKADCLFPRAYDDFAREILAQLEGQFGAPALDSVLKARADQLIAQLKRDCEGLDFEDRLKRLTQVINEKGYAAETRKQKDGTFNLTQRNCPTETIAVSYPQVCEQELRVYREVLGCEVIRDCRISTGAQTCGYRLVPHHRLSLRVLQNVAP